ncbi:MAG: amidase [Promethearchaeota archaeon]
MKKEDICFMSACEMAEKIKTQELTSQEITEKIIDRIEKINPIINAYCTPTLNLAREMAKFADDKVKKGEKLGKLNGIPTSIKDLIKTAGIRTTFGCVLFENNIPEKDELVVKRLKEAGIVLLGKTNTPAFGHKAVTHNMIFGETKNPWNLKRTSGGSSGGAAAIVASGLGPLALGTDGGGSIRIPSSLCGVFGLKPNFGRIPHLWDKTNFYRLSQNGPIVRYVKDAALMLDVMGGFSDIDKYSFPNSKSSFIEALKEIPTKIKIGYSLDLGFVKAIDPEIKKCVIDSVHKFEKFNWPVENIKIKLKQTYKSYVTLVVAGLAYDFRKYLKAWKEKMTPTFVNMIEGGINTTGMDIMNAEMQSIKFYNYFAEYFKKYDILITPTTAVTAFELGKMFPDKIGDRAVSPAGWMPFTYLFNLTGHPAASIPCGWSNEGLPIGMQIIGPRANEKLVLQVAKAFEKIAPWQDKKPKFN